MNQYFKAPLFYWLGVWISFLGICLAMGGIKSLSYPEVYEGILLTALLSFIAVGLIALGTKSVSAKPKYVRFCLWVIAPILLISVYFELQFHVLTGHIHGLDSLRNGFFAMIINSLFWSWLSFRFFLRNQ